MRLELLNDGGNLYPEGEEDKFLRNVVNHQQDYVA
jgi:hypothetical protein